MGSATAPVITANGSVDLCPGNTVTLTSSTNGNYLWSTGATTQSIIVSTAGTYSVSSGSGSCVLNSSPLTVTTNGATTPIVSTSGSLDICAGTSVTLSSSVANGYLWSTGETTTALWCRLPGAIGFVDTFQEIALHSR